MDRRFAMGGTVVTTKQVSQLRRMNQAGLNDYIISERLGVPVRTVCYNRNKLGLTVNQKRRYRRYEVYDGKTTEYLFEGTARECAERMGITKTGFNRAFQEFFKGNYKKYEIYEVENVD